MTVVATISVSPYISYTFCAPMRSIQASLTLSGHGPPLWNTASRLSRFRLENEGCLIIRSIIVGASPTNWILCFSMSSNAWPSSKRSMRYTVCPKNSPMYVALLYRL